MNDLERKFNQIEKNASDGFNVICAEDKLHSKEDAAKLDRYLLINTPYQTSSGERVYGFAIQPLRINGSEPNTVELYAAKTDMNMPSSIAHYCPNGCRSIDDKEILNDNGNLISIDKASEKMGSVAKDSQYGEVVLEYDNWKEITEARFKKLKLPVDDLGSASYNKYLDKCSENMIQHKNLHHYINADIRDVDSYRMSDPEAAAEFENHFGDYGE